MPATKFENIVSEQLPLRRDFRSHRIYTIDPATAKDLDDAIHIETCADGTYEVGVHIADVSFFVRAASNIDAYAAKRGTTTYLTQYCLLTAPGRTCSCQVSCLVRLALAPARLPPQYCRHSVSAGHGGESA